MSQAITSSRFPYLPIHLRVHIKGVAASDFDFEALLDPGFDGGVALPTHWLAPYPLAGYLPWGLADGSQVLTPAYRGEATIGQLPPAPMVVIALGDEPIVGPTLANRFKITLDHGHTLTVEP